MKREGERGEGKDKQKNLIAGYKNSSQKKTSSYQQQQQQQINRINIKFNYCDVTHSNVKKQKTVRRKKKNMLTTQNKHTHRKNFFFNGGQRVNTKFRFDIYRFEIYFFFLQNSSRNDKFFFFFTKRFSR